VGVYRDAAQWLRMSHSQERGRVLLTRVTRSSDLGFCRFCLDARPAGQVGSWGRAGAGP
jgi:hypothetical protein